MGVDGRIGRGFVRAGDDAEEFHQCQDDHHEKGDYKGDQKRNFE